MKATIPDQAAEAAQGWVLYDGDCSLCTRAAWCFKGVLERNGFALAPLQTNWVSRRFGFNSNVQPTEMLVLLPDGRAVGGADGLVQIARRIWWAWPLFALAQIPGAMILLRAVYRQVAANRRCLNGACRRKAKVRHHGASTFWKMP